MFVSTPLPETVIKCFPTGIWHQYDGFVHPKPWFGSSVMDWLFGDGLNREYVVKEFFPKWNGFFADIENDDYTAVTAAKQLNFLLSSVSWVWISVANNPIHTYVPSLDIPKVSFNILCRFIALFIGKIITKNIPYKIYVSIPYFALINHSDVLLQFVKEIPRDRIYLFS